MSKLEHIGDKRTTSPLSETFLQMATASSIVAASLIGTLRPETKKRDKNKSNLNYLLDLFFNSRIYRYVIIY